MVCKGILLASQRVNSYSVFNINRLLDKAYPQFKLQCVLIIKSQFAMVPVVGRQRCHYVKVIYNQMLVMLIFDFQLN